MERLGTADRVAQGLLVVRLDTEPEIGDDVLTEDLEVVGTVVDVFGPTAAPFAGVTPDEGTHPAAHVGSALYVR